jgi:hypothetical protein
MICLVLCKLILFSFLLTECIECISFLYTGPAAPRYDVCTVCLVVEGSLSSPLCLYRNTRVNLSGIMNRVGPSWDPMDPNVLSVVDPNSDLGRDLAISLQATAEEEEEENNTGRLTDE